MEVITVETTVNAPVEKAWETFSKPEHITKWAFATDGYTSNHLKYFKADDTYRDDIGNILRSPIEWIGAEYRMGGIFSTPAISGNSIVISSTEGVVYCLRRS